MGGHTFNVITFTPFHNEKEKKKFENEKNIQNSDQGERQDHFMISCFVNIIGSINYFHPSVSICQCFSIDLKLFYSFQSI